MTYRIIQADLLKYLRDHQWIVQRGYMPKYHAVLCDPPYFLGSIVKRFGADDAAPAQYGSDGVFQRSSAGFMGQTWDGFESPQHYQAWVTEWATLMLDFVYPGAVLMAFGGTRTYHRLVCGLEDAGWEIYDSIIAWVYGTGFPKSHDLSKAIDKQAGIEREVVGEQKGARNGNGRNVDYGTFASAGDVIVNISAPATPEAAQWEGYGTALKPSYEPIVIARAPRQGHTYAECALKFGTGGLNIEGGRIEHNEPSKTTVRKFTSGQQSQTMNDGRNMRKWEASHSGTGLELPASASPLGRWPANTILTHHPACTATECVPDCHVRVLGEQSGDVKSGSAVSGNEPSVPGSGAVFNHRNRIAWQPYNDEGSAARFFYQAKAANWERDAGLEDFALQNAGMMEDDNYPIETGSGNLRDTQRRNPHPTVKPIQLIEYLATLIKPPIANARLFVPFSGSGSEMIGAQLAGWTDIIGIEQSAEYIPIARARLKWWAGFDTYEQARASAQSGSRGKVMEQKAQAAGQLRLFDNLEAAS